MPDKGLASILDLLRVGHGPSSSHTLGPVRAARLYLADHPGDDPLRVTLYGALAAAAAAWLMGGTPRQIEYAAETGIEHHLGLSCDPVMGLVQIPCIERNAFAAMRALACAEYALLSDGRHRICLDEVVAVMLQTGRDMHPAYRETSRAGLAAVGRSSPEGE